MAQTENGYLRAVLLKKEQASSVMVGFLNFHHRFLPVVAKWHKKLKWGQHYIAFFPIIISEQTE